jgi:hypothetical protein
MKEVWDQVIKVIPPEMIPIILLLAVSFFGIHYGKGWRNYTDTLNDRWFLASAVIIVSAFLLFWIFRSEAPKSENNLVVTLLVPRFEGDEGRQFEKLFTQQVQAAVQSLRAQATVVQINAYITDQSSAALTARAHNAPAIIYQPRVLRIDGKTFICFSLFTVNQEVAKAYPPFPPQFDPSALAEFSRALVNSERSLQSQASDPVVARVTALEQQLATLNTSISRIAAQPQCCGGVQDSGNKQYSRRRAIVVGVNRYESHQFPQLRYAVSDAQSMSQYLKSSGFEVNFFADVSKYDVRNSLNDLIKNTLEKDLTVFYFAGMSARSTDLLGKGSSEELIIATSDVDVSSPLANLTLGELVVSMKKLSGDKLIILDGCHGTFGLSPAPQVQSTSSTAEIFQIIAASQDAEVAAELPGGGAFTQALLTGLKNGSGSGTYVPTREIIAQLTPLVLEKTNGNQRPKLVTLTGIQDIYLVRH